MSEHDEQCAVIRWFNLQYQAYNGCLFAIPNGSVLAGNKSARARQMNALKAEGFKPGVSDLFLMVARGDHHGLFIEMKDKGKTACSVSDSQKAHLELAEREEYMACWCPGSESAINVIKEYMDQSGE